MLKEGSFINRETSKSRAEQTHPSWEHEWVVSTFSCMLQCNQEDCGDMVACGGSGGYEVLNIPQEYGGVDTEEVEYFIPHFFYPALGLMDIPVECPESVSKHLKQSFLLAFSDPGASLNSIRSAIEALMSDLGVLKYREDDQKRPISLHARIESMPETFVKQKELLLALKWLGNAGSHEGGATKAQDMWYAFDVIEHVLSAVYDQKIQRLLTIARRVNRQKGPLDVLDYSNVLKNDDV
ncbi:hypothetical protein DelCs14_3880 [Delftia sp. Cs1-4]|nr:hypothetical protein DelCs14_3880 [Delftia sp. Cs1-4]